MEANSSLTTLKKNEPFNHETCTCPNDECGKNFDRPIELTVLSSNPVETYPACPYCMSRIDIAEEEQKPTKNTLTSLRIRTVLEKEQEKAEKKETDETKCSHGFGYLKKRQKGTPIPDECLLCQKMIQCLA
jgi:DNA-directed RNA polymerase subunit RPC12/RpoP